MEDRFSLHLVGIGFIAVVAGKILAAAIAKYLNFSM